MNRVAFITGDLLPMDGVMQPGGCAYYRQMLPMNAALPHAAFGEPAFVGELGFGVITGHNKAAFGFDTVVIKMLMQRWMPAQIRMAKKAGQRIIVDMDDHYAALHEANRAFAGTDPSLNKIANRDILDEVIREADVLTVSTPELYDYYQRRGIKDIRLIRNGVNPRQFPERKVRNRKPVLGWVGAIGWRANDIETLYPWFNDFLVEYDLRFHHSGHTEDAPSFAEVAGIDPKRVTTSPMQNLSNYASLFAFDVGIVPMDDIPFNYAKSTIKGLEYALSGIPFVAQGLPEYERLEGTGVGRVAWTEGDWVKELTALLDYRTRKEAARKNRQNTINLHLIQYRLPEWRDLFEEGKPAPLRNQEVTYVLNK